MKIIKLIILALLIDISCEAQNCKCKHLILYKGIVALDNFEAPSVQYKKNSNRYDIYYLKDCFGTMDYKQTDSNGVILKEGILIGNSKLISQKIYQYDLDLNVKDSSVLKVYHPFKNGLWNYYDDNGRLLRTEFYKNDSIIWNKAAGTLNQKKE